jgi:hypothetical protein
LFEVGASVGVAAQLAGGARETGRGRAVSLLLLFFRLLLVFQSRLEVLDSFTEAFRELRDLLAAEQQKSHRQDHN